MALVDAGKIIGKTLVPRVDVAKWDKLPENGGKKIGIIKAGTGFVVYSYVLSKKDNSLYWMVTTPGGGCYFVQHGTGRFDFDVLQQQGVKTTAQEIKEKENAGKSSLEKLSDSLKNNIGKVLLYGALIGGGFFLIGKLIDRTKK